MPPKKTKKRKKRGAQASFLLRLGHGALEATKQMKKGGTSSLSAKSWQWRLRSNKKLLGGGGEQVPLLSRVGDGVVKSTKKKQKNKSLAPPLSRHGDGTQ